MTLGRSLYTFLLLDRSLLLLNKSLLLLNRSLLLLNRPVLTRVYPDGQHFL